MEEFWNRLGENMQKDSGKSIVKKIASKNMKNEKRRNIMVVIAVILSSFLISFTGMLATSLLQEQKNQVTDTYEAVYINISEKDIETLQKYEEFERVGKYYIAGEEKSDNGFTASFFYVDEPMIYMSRNQMALVEGQLPQKTDEIAVSKNWLKNYSSDKKVGSKVTLGTESFQGEYIISGILEADQGSGEIYPFFISEDTLKRDDDYKESSYLAYVHLEENIKVANMKEVCSKIAKENGLLVNFHDKYFRYAEKAVSTEQIGVLVAIATIVLVGSCVVIQSIFQISIIDKIQNYGQLRTIGATRKQIKKIVKKEGRQLGIVGIVSGILLGSVLSVILMPEGFNVLNYGGVYFITILVCYSMVALSIHKPIAIASKASPIDASKILLKDKKLGTVRKKSRTLSPSYLGIMNFKRDRKKVISIIISLSLGGILLLVLASMLLVQSPERLARRFYPDGDFKIYIDSDREHVDVLRSGNPLNDDLRDKIMSIPGVNGIVVGRQSAAFSFDLKGVTGHGVCDMITSDNEEKIDASIVEGTMPYDSYGIIVSNSFADFGEKPSIGTELKFSLGEKSVSVTIQGYFQASKLSIAQGHGRNGMDAPTIYIPEDLFKELLPDVESYDYSWNVVNEPQMSGSVETKLTNIANTHTELGVDSVFSRIKEYESNNAAVYGAMEVVSWLIFLFGVINLINTTLSNQVSRQFENSVLRSVGLTYKQLYKMTISEGICYIISSVVLTLGIGVPLSLVVCQQLSIINYGKAISYQFPFAYMGTYLIVLVSLEMLLSVWTMKRQKKKSVIEQLRTC